MVIPLLVEVMHGLYYAPARRAIFPVMALTYPSSRRFLPAPRLKSPAPQP
jgi:hypothetical protein